MTFTFQPKKGSTAGGEKETVTITGGPWDEETLMFTSVMFDGYAATRIDPGDPDSTVDYKRYKSIKASPPRHKAGPVSITLTTPDGSNTEKDKYTYVFEISDVNPPKATVPKDQIVVVAITGNDLAKVDSVKFGDKVARFGHIDSEHIWAAVPYSEKTGKVLVQVKTPHGENEKTPIFEYI